MLLASAVFMTAMPMVYGPAYIRALGPARMIGNRENMPAIEGWFARARRGHANMIESLLPFTAIVLVAHLAGVHSGWTRGGAVLFLVARLLHFAAYTAGVGFLRTTAFVAGLAGMLTIASAVAFG